MRLEQWADNNIKDYFSDITKSIVHFALWIWIWCPHIIELNTHKEENRANHQWPAETLHSLDTSTSCIRPISLPFFSSNISLPWWLQPQSCCDCQSQEDSQTHILAYGVPDNDDDYLDDDGDSVSTIEDNNLDELHVPTPPDDVV